jgi:hypothetical protein
MTAQPARRPVGPVALVAGALLAAMVAGCSRTPAATTTLPSVNVGSVPLGIYAGSGDPTRIAGFAARTGAKPSLASDYLPRTNGWAGMVTVDGLRHVLAPWQGSRYRLVLGVPMLPTRGGRQDGTMTEGAAGRYDAEFATLARTLVHYGQGDAVLRVGWEFNGTWYPWSVTNRTEAAHFVGYFHNIVTSMRAVPGADFRFVWNATSGSEPLAASYSYPGNAYVDYIGLDLYDQVWGIPQDPGLAWPRYVTEVDGLQWLASFASAHQKPAVIPEWGLTVRSDGHGLGDDPLYVAKMAQWISTHHVAFTSYFDVDAPDGQHDILDRAFARSLAVFERSFEAARPSLLATPAG